MLFWTAQKSCLTKERNHSFPLRRCFACSVEIGSYVFGVFDCCSTPKPISITEKASLLSYFLRYLPSWLQHTVLRMVSFFTSFLLASSFLGFIILGSSFLEASVAHVMLDVLLMAIKSCPILPVLLSTLYACLWMPTY